MHGDGNGVSRTKDPPPLLVGDSSTFIPVSSVDAVGSGLNPVNFVIPRQIRLAHPMIMEESHPGGFGITREASNPDTTWTDVTRVSMRGMVSWGAGRA